MPDPGEATTIREALERERELLKAHFDEEAGPHSYETAAKAGLRIAGLADSLLSKLADAERERDARRERKVAVEELGKALRESEQRVVALEEALREILEHARADPSYMSGTYASVAVKALAASGGAA